MTLEFTVTPTYEDYYAANRLVRTKAWSPAKIAKPALIMFLVCVVFAQLAATSDGVPWREQLPYSLSIGIVAAAVWLLVCFGFGELRLGAQARKMFDQLGTVSLPASYRIDSEGMWVENDEGHSKHAWSRIQDYLLDSHVLILRRTDTIFYLIPVGQLPNGALPQLIDVLAKADVKRG